ncbi:hypothetical protein JCM16814_12900 [Desulfobaculum senezii]
MDWYRITLSMQDVAAGETARLQDKFIHAVNQNTAAADMQMYALNEDDRPYSVFYFSPGCGEIILKQFLDYQPAACGQPNIDDLMLLVGQGRAAT